MKQGWKLVLLLLLALPSHGFIQRATFTLRVCRRQCAATTTSLRMAEEEDNKFGFSQRIESIKVLALGAIAGSLASIPFSLADDLLFKGLQPVNTNALAQWEFDQDAAAVESGLFAIVYRYCVRQDENPQLKQGIVGAFVVVRTLSRIVVPPYCTAFALDCGAPFGYVDWDIIAQAAVNGVVSQAMFGATAAALDYAMYRGYISKFPG